MPIASEESEVDIEVEEMDESSGEDFDGKEEEEVGEDELEDSENDPEANGNQSTGTSSVPPLKIKLKLGAQPVTSDTKGFTLRRYARFKNEDVESEDSDSQDSQFNTYAAGPTSGRSHHLTARQAALASAVDPSHVNLDTAKEGGSSKKPQATPSEVALRKEENARKRKNMIEKKLEDEKAETIHRLLKKQSRPKNKRNAAAQSDEDVDMDDEDGASTPARAPSMPMYRWVSTSRPLTAQQNPTSSDVGSEAAVSSMSISFSIPPSFLPSTDNATASEEKTMTQLLSGGASKCAVDGCGGERKYRVVGKAWGIGACGLMHLKMLEGTV
ncbi:PAPA-1-like conserved region-domain-containing protein [Mycena sp. CBHHK59/15]|nr:PAPA-1-like conserved region-domain-containing protein [Mycena sp. CBHHK59/15]